MIVKSLACLALLLQGVEPRFLPDRVKQLRLKRLLRVGRLETTVGEGQFKIQLGVLQVLVA